MKSIYLSYSYGKIEHSFIEMLRNELERFDFRIINVFPNIICSDFELENTNQNSINKCDLLIAIISEYNPNVFFELGYAIGRGKQILIVGSIGIDLPRSLKNINYIVGDPYEKNIIFEIINQIEKMKFIQTKKVENINDLEFLINSYDNDQDFFDKIEPIQFEEIIGQFFRRMNYEIYPNENPNEYGYDFLITNYGNYGKTLVEIKKYNRNSKISVGQIQQFLGAIYFNKAECGIFITTSGFTRSAIDFAERATPKIELWDIDNLINRIKLDNNV